MKITAIALSRLRLASRANLGGATARLHHIDEAAGDGAGGVHRACRTDDRASLAPIRLLGFVAILAIAAGGGAAGVLNMWYEADIDALMTRTARRPIPRGTVSRPEALAFGTHPCLQRRRGSCSRSQFQGRGAARLRHLLLRRRLHDLAQAKHTAEHRDRRRCRRASADDRLGGGKWRDRA